MGGRLFALVILATLVLLGGTGPGLVLFLRLLGVAVVAGAVAGTIQGSLHRLDDWGGLGTWLRWTGSMFGYVVVFGFLTPSWPFSLRDPALYAIAAGMSTLGAACLMLMDERRPGRPSPRRFRLLQNREFLWSAADRVQARRDASALLGDQDFEAQPVSGRSREGVSSRQRVKAEWMETIRRSTGRLTWWTRD